MRITLTIEGLNEKEARRVLLQIAEQGSDKDISPDVAVKEAGYLPSGERTRLALDALLKCQRVKLRDPKVIESFALAYPDVDLVKFFLGLDAWAVTNNVTRSTKGWAKSCTSNLRIAQDKAGRAHLMGVSPGLQGTPVTHTVTPVHPAVDAWAKASE